MADAFDILNALTKKGETWRPMAGWKNYLISDHGRVFSLARNRLKSLYPAKNGYNQILLSQGQKKSTANVCRLVLLSFKGDENPTGRLQCAHGDGIRNNDFLSNLRWVTAKGNSDDKVRHGTMMLGEHHYAAKVSALGARIIYRLVANRRLSNPTIGKIFSISPMQVWKIGKGLRWRSVLNHGSV